MHCKLARLATHDNALHVIWQHGLQKQTQHAICTTRALVGHAVLTEGLLGAAHGLRTLTRRTLTRKTLTRRTLVQLGKPLTSVWDTRTLLHTFLWCGFGFSLFCLLCFLFRRRQGIEYIPIECLDHGCNMLRCFRGSRDRCDAATTHNLDWAHQNSAHRLSQNGYGYIMYYMSYVLYILYYIYDNNNNDHHNHPNYVLQVMLKHSQTLWCDSFVHHPKKVE